MLQKKEFTSLPPNVGMMGRPRRRREQSQPAHPRLWRQSLLTGLTSPMTAHRKLWRQSLPTSFPGPMRRGRRPCHPACLWWEVPGPTAAQCLPEPAVLNTMDHVVMIGTDEVMGRTGATTHQGPATRPDVVEVGSCPGPRLWEGPALEPGTRIRRMLWGLIVLQGGRRRSSLPALPLISVITRGHRWIAGPGRDLGIMTDMRVWTAWGLAFLTCPDGMCSCPHQLQRRLRREPSLWSLRLPDQHTQMTRQVWRAR